MSGSWRSGLVCEIVNLTGWENFAFFRENAGEFQNPMTVAPITRISPSTLNGVGM